MLSPEYLRMITERTEQKVSEVNEYLTTKIIKRIVKLFEETGEVKLIPSSLLDLKKQQFAGRLLDEIQAELEKQLPNIRNEIRRAFYDAGAKIANDVNATTGEILKTVQRNGDLKDISVPKFESKQKASKLSDLNMTEKEISCLESAYRRTQGELYNLTKTSANSAQQTFIRACDTAYFKATHGTSLDTAIVEAIREVSEKGITTVHYASGHEDKIEVAIARAVRAGVNQANGDITLTRCAEAGVNYVITSSHIGARVTPYADYRTHADWQGQVYNLNWGSPELAQYEPQLHEKPKGKFSFLNNMKEFFQNQKNKKYKDFIETCGYGKMLGICGINCRHSFGLFYPGISINNQIQYDSEENKKRYQQEQKQRAMERGIRLIKRELNVLDGSGLDSAEAKMRKCELKELLQTKDVEYKSYCQKNGLKPLNYRLQVAKVSGVNNVGVVLSEDSDTLKSLRKKVEKGINKKIEHAPIKLEDWKNEHKDSIMNVIQNAPDKIRQATEKYSDKIKIFNEKLLGSAYASGKGIAFNVNKDLTDKRGRWTAFFHEMGHIIDRCTGRISSRFPEFRKFLISDFENIANEYQKVYNMDKKSTYAEISNVLESSAKYHSISDLIGGITNNECCGAYTHDSDYWKKKNALEREAFAHFFEATIRNDLEKIEVIKEMFPNAYNVFEKLIEVIIS